MIHAIRANKSSFKAVEFTEGFNVVLADRTKESTKKDSRNGLGKTMLIEILHFCLGASTRLNKGLRVKPLKGWRFSLDLSVRDRRVTVHRGVDSFGKVDLEGDIQGWGETTLAGHRLTLPVKEWTQRLGEEMFGLPSTSNGEIYQPTFRSLIGYIARRGRDAFSTPFEHFRKQKEWDKQVQNAYLLGLSWEDAQAWQKLKDEEKVLSTLKKAVSSGVMEGMVGTVGELEAEKVRLSELAQRQAEALRSFRVHPEYRQIEQQASALTQEIHSLSNENIGDRRMLSYYQESLAEVEEPEAESVTNLYRQAGIELGDSVVRRLEEVKTFHRQLIKNRRTFLSTEVERIEALIGEREAEIRQLAEKRAELMTILEKHGALEEYTQLQQRHLGTVAMVKDVETRLGNLRKFETGKSALKIDHERLQQRARRDHDDRRPAWERAVSLFNAHSEALYQAPGRLVIDIGDKGFKFNVEIERSGSQGIDSMKVFCYDLMLAQILNRRERAPGFLVHDSTIFDGVDERQVALALERAKEVSAQDGFQYICTLNSDTLPLAELSKDFDIESLIRLRLTDAKPEGCLFGFRF